MKLSDQVCTLEQAQRLKELGVDGDSLFAREESGLPGEWRVTYPSEYARQTKALYPAEIKWIPAWTAGELGVAITSSVIGSTYYLRNYHGNNILWYDQHSRPRTFNGENEAQARAALLIYLLENNLVKVEDVNNRLKQ